MVALFELIVWIVDFIVPFKHRIEFVDGDADYDAGHLRDLFLQSEAFCLHWLRPES